VTKTTRKLKFLQDTRAITPVLSNLLLTIVAVAAMSLATTATYVITTNLKETMSERIVVEDLWFNNSTGGVEIFLHNVGKIAVQISAVYITHDGQTTHLSASFTLEKGQHGWFNVSYGWVSGDLYFVKIASSRGLHVEDYYKAP
jgi:hypothetical protein